MKEILRANDTIVFEEDKEFRFKSVVSSYCRVTSLLGIATFVWVSPTLIVI